MCANQSAAAEHRRTACGISSDVHSAANAACTRSPSFAELTRRAAPHHATDSAQIASHQRLRFSPNIAVPTPRPQRYR